MESRETKLNSSFTEDLVENILLKLPVKSLLRFRSVSQRWCALTKSSDFIGTHHKHFRAFIPKPYLLIHWNLKSDIFSLSSLQDEATLSRLDSPPYQKGRMEKVMRFVGSSDGLVCLAITEEVSKKTTDIIVWNPATKKYNNLPKPRPLSGAIREYFGFTHEISTGYKLVKISVIADGGNACTCKAQVFTQSSNCWKKVEGELLHPNRFSYASVCLNGVLYWLAPTHPSNQCFSFNLRDEKFQVTMMLPSFTQPHYYIILCSWKNSLAFFEASSLEVWVACNGSVTERSGTQVPWTKEFTLLSAAYESFLGVWNDQFLFSESRGNVHSEYLYLFNPRSKSATKLHIHHPDIFYYCDGVDYAESLVQV